MLIVAGSVGVTPAQFWEMTLREFDLYVRGYGRRMEMQHSLVAWHAANLMNCWVKKKITPKMLMGKEDSAVDVRAQLKAQAKKHPEIKVRVDRELDTAFAAENDPPSWIDRLTLDDSPASIDLDEDG